MSKKQYLVCSMATHFIEKTGAGHLSRDVLREMNGVRREGLSKEQKGWSLSRERQSSSEGCPGQRAPQVLRPLSTMAGVFPALA